MSFERCDDEDLRRARRGLALAEEEIASVKAELALERHRRRELEKDVQNMAEITARLEMAEKEVGVAKAELAIERKLRKGLEEERRNVLVPPDSTRLEARRVPTANKETLTKVGSSKEKSLTNVNSDLTAIVTKKDTKTELSNNASFPEIIDTDENRGHFPDRNRKRVPALASTLTFEPDRPISTSALSSTIPTPTEESVRAEAACTEEDADTASLPSDTDLVPSLALDEIRNLEHSQSELSLTIDSLNSDQQPQEIRLYYISAATKDVQNSDLDDILDVSKRNNERDGITGILMSLESHFFQVLEGKSRAVLRAFDRIRRDDRHSNARILHLDRGITDRLFGEWSMKGINYNLSDPSLDAILKPIKALLLCMTSAYCIIERYADSSVCRLLSVGINPLTVKPAQKEFIVMFADIRSFSTLSERLPVNVVVSLVNAYFEISSKVIQARGGEINKFIGDCVMAYFPAQNAVGALEAGLEILSLLKKMRKVSKLPFAKLLNVCIGMAKGPVIMGNMGSVHKKDFTLMGDAVNVAARLESTTRGVKRNLVFDCNILSALKESDATFHTFESLGEINVKGRSAAVDVWTTRDSIVSDHMSKAELDDMISDVTGGRRRSQVFSSVSDSDLQDLERCENIKSDLMELEEEREMRNYELGDSFSTLGTFGTLGMIPVRRNYEFGDSFSTLGSLGYDDMIPVRKNNELGDSFSTLGSVGMNPRRR